MTKSDSIAKIAKALIVFQKEMNPIKKDAVNTTHQSKYASLANILESIAGPLQRAGLAISQHPTPNDGLITLVMHKSGEFIESNFNMPANAKEVPTEAGARISYQRRYALAAALSLHIENEVVDTHSTETAPSEGVDSVDERPWIQEDEYNKATAEIVKGNPDIYSATVKKYRMSQAAARGLYETNRMHAIKKETRGEKV